MNILNEMSQKNLFGKKIVLNLRPIFNKKTI